jgi:hypothetical protein
LNLSGKSAVIERVLLLIALAHVIAGLALAMLPFAPALQIKLLTAIFGEGHASTETLFLFSVFGPTVASWGVLFYALVRSYFRNPARDTWRALALSILIWAPLDSALCIYYGLYSAVALNAAVAVTILGLLLGVRK